MKTGLKKQEVLVKEPETGSWALAPRFLEPGAAVPAHSTPRIEDPQDTRVGRIILEALTAAGEAGLAGGELVEAARSRGIPRSEVAATRQSLRAAGLIDCDLAHGARWRIARSSRSRTCETFPPNLRDGTATP